MIEIYIRQQVNLVVRMELLPQILRVIPQQPASLKLGPVAISGAEAVHR